MMTEFIAIFAVAIITLLAVQAADVECQRPRAARRRAVFARKSRMPFRLTFRNTLGGEAR